MRSVELFDRKAVFISGTVGAGKTRTAEAVGQWLQERGVPHAVIDLDWLRRSWPGPPGDPFNNAVELRNLQSVARAFLDAGAARLVLAGVLEKPAARTLYQEAVGVPLSVARLHVDLSVVRCRLKRRHADEPTALAWHLNRSGQLDAILQHARIEDVTIAVDGDDVSQVAAAVVRAVGWEETRTRH